MEEPSFPSGLFTHPIAFRKSLRKVLLMARNRLLPLLIVFTPMLMASNCRKPPQTEVVNGTETLVQSPESVVQVAVVEPSFGTADEAFEVEVIGTGFENMARVRWGDVESPRVRFLDDNTLLATVPPLG